MDPSITSHSQLNQKTIDFIKSLRAALPFYDKGKVEESLGMSRSEFRKVLNGEGEFNVIEITNLSRDFNFSLKALEEGKIDIDSVIKKFEGKTTGIPQRYEGKPPGSKSYFIISSLDFTEQSHGPNLKKLALEYLQIEDHLYEDPNGYVTLEVLVDLLIFLHDHGMTREEIQNLGAYSFYGILNSPESSDFAKFENTREFLIYFFEVFASEVAASHYQFKLLKNTDEGLIIQVTDAPETLLFKKGEPMGSQFCCYHMLGGFGEVLKHRGIHHYEDSHPHCRHRGDEFCIFEFNFPKIS